jgi:DNA modification methylase
MPFKFNPPTRTICSVCDVLHTRDASAPVIDSHNGKASSANNFPFHNWYNFVLGYSPEFPDYMIRREGMTEANNILDPFMGSGTTLVCCKSLGIPSEGIDANDFMVEAARVKLNWNVNLAEVRRYREIVLSKIEKAFANYEWSEEARAATFIGQLHLPSHEEGKPSYRAIVEQRRPEMLLPKYISDKPLAKVYLIHDCIEDLVEEGPVKKLLDLALSSIILAISNVRYGPGFGIIKPIDDKDVLGIFASKLDRMIADLSSASDNQKKTKSLVVLGDSRALADSFDPDSADLMITSPPYPGDHEYTKHTRLELIFRGYATNIPEFRTIKRRMLRGSTTNLYNDDFDREPVQDMESIRDVTNLIQERLEHDGATSGFEKLYTKLVWEYFGGMYKTLSQCRRVLRPGGKIALLVSDSHAFKMVHIQTASILKEIGERAGYINPEIVLWQLKSTTSHKYELRENVLILQKSS